MLSLTVFTSSARSTLLVDLSARAGGLTFTTTPHGFGILKCVVPFPLAEAFRLYDRPGLPHVVVSAYGLTVWEGRLEDVSIMPGGVRLVAFGYWRAMSDVPYTALWSTTSVAGWMVTTDTDIINRVPERYVQDNNNRLYFALVKNNVYSHNTTTASWHYRTPSNGQRQVVTLSFDYDITLPASWTLRTVGHSSAWAGGTVADTITGTGSQQTGSKNLTLTACDIVELLLTNQTGSNYTMTGETGSFYVKITNVRIKTTASASVYADEIVKALVAFVNGANSAQLDSGTALIQSPTLDLRDEVYEDEWPADIITRLAALGDNQTPPRQWEAVVWEDRVLRFQPQGTGARTWYVDISALELERSLNLLRNSAYAIYREAGGRKLRTAASTDSDSVARYGVTRREKVNTATTSSTQAAVYRDAYLEDNADPKPQARITFDQLYDATGNRVPNWLGRAGDIIVIRNLPPTLSVDVDRIRTFRSSFTVYDAPTNRISFTPEAPLPSLDFQVARLAAGIRG